LIGKCNEGQEDISTTSLEVMEHIEKVFEKVKVVDTWVEKLMEKGKKSIKKARKKYEELKNKLNEIDELIEQCDNELFYFEGILPKLNRITQLDEDLVEKEGIVPIEHMGTQYAIEDLTKLRVEVLNGIKEKMETKKKR
ncbi:hypothetical protein KI387_038479, partial [Taxus chinensis]